MSALRRAIANLAVRPLLGGAGGAALGWAYSHYVGCLTGTCPLTSNPWFMIAFGGWLGYSFFSGSGKPAREAPIQSKAAETDGKTASLARAPEEPQA